jgi:hypothetical protein
VANQDCAVSIRLRDTAAPGDGVLCGSAVTILNGGFGGAAVLPILNVQFNVAAAVRTITLEISVFGEPGSAVTISAADKDGGACLTVDNLS